jgi:hypothetical protein
LPPLHQFDTTDSSKADIPRPANEPSQSLCMERGGRQWEFKLGWRRYAHTPTRPHALQVHRKWHIAGTRYDVDLHICVPKHSKIMKIGCQSHSSPECIVGTPRATGWSTYYGRVFSVQRSAFSVQRDSTRHYPINLLLHY